MAKQSGIKRFYTWEVMEGCVESELGDKLIKHLLPYSLTHDIEILMNKPCFRDKLANVGVHLLNRQHNIQTFIYNVATNEDADKMEEEIKAYAASIGIIIHNVLATLDYDVIAEKAMAGLLVLNEEIVMPNTSTDLEALLYTYIEQLDSKGNTVIITDPFLFASSEADYIVLIRNILERTKAKTIKLLMPANQNNSTYKLIITAFKYTSFVFKVYNDCHDRFWLCPETEKGLMMGASLNGIGKKISRLHMLEQEEVNVLLTELGKV